PRRNFLERWRWISWTQFLASIEGDSLELNLGDRGAALAYAREAVDEAERLRREDTGDPSALLVVAGSRMQLARLLRASDNEAAIAEYHAAVRHYRELLKRSPTNIRFQREIERANAEMALSLRLLGQDEGALEALNKALEVERTLHEPRAFTRIEMGDFHR